MKIRSLLLSLLLLAGFSITSEASILRRDPRLGPQPCGISHYDSCNNACDFFDSQCWYNCMWNGGSSAPGPIGAGTSAFKGCSGTCGDPCQMTACDAACRNNGSTACAACCNIHYNRALRDCDGKQCQVEQTGEWNDCKLACSVPM
jgi:hypothetical protein